MLVSRLCVLFGYFLNGVTVEQRKFLGSSGSQGIKVIGRKKLTSFFDGPERSSVAIIPNIVDTSSSVAQMFGTRRVFDSVGVCKNTFQ